MTPYLTCDAASELLQGFADDELAMAERVAVESHLRWCRVCEARVSDIRLIGTSLRLVAQAGPGVDHPDLATVQSSVLARVRAERAQSFVVQWQDMFVDMRLLWPALGASVAVVTCLFAATGMFEAATLEDHPNSMAGMIDMLANPGSDQNPMSLDGRLSAPRAIDAGLVVGSIAEEDVVYALSAVVTREGRVSNYELLLSERASVRRREKAAESDDSAAALLAAVKRSRFEPAQTRAGGAVAVNVVWLLARTTVRGSSRVEIELPRDVTHPAPRVREKAVDAMPAVEESPAAPSPTA
jgi:hypothetical protein